MKSQLYRHYKGPLYRVFAEATHSESLEKLVFYECLYENPQGPYWVRPQEMFHEGIIYNGKSMQRFTPIQPEVHLYSDFQEVPWEDVYLLLHAVFKESFENKVKERLKTHFLVQTLVLDGQLIGCKIGYELSENTFYSWLGAVDEQWRQFGFAGLLMQKQHEWCREKGYSVIQTKSRNEWPSMVKLNLDHGFKIVGIENKTPTRIMMEKQLS